MFWFQGSCQRYTRVENLGDVLTRNSGQGGQRSCKNVKMGGHPLFFISFLLTSFLKIFLGVLLYTPLPPSTVCINGTCLFVAIITIRKKDDRMKKTSSGACMKDLPKRITNNRDYKTLLIHFMIQSGKKTNC